VAKSLSQGVREKLRRANLHRADFDRRAERFVYGNAYSVVRHDDVQAGKRSWIVQVHKRPPIVRWGALIGDCLFNYRSALDNLAYDLAVAYSGFPLKPEVETGSAFPIFTTRAPTRAELDKKVGGMDPQARDIIEKMQPYGRSDRAALGYLDTLQNFDKHRTVHLVAGIAKSFGHYGENPVDEVNFLPFKHGDVIATGPLDPELDNEPHFTFGIALGEGGPVATTVSLLLHWIGQHVEQRVIPPLLPFL
jgi:hypothetical protein